MLLSGSWAFIETARLYAERCGYSIIATDIILPLSRQQMNERAEYSAPRNHRIPRTDQQL